MKSDQPKGRSIELTYRQKEKLDDLFKWSKEQAYSSAHGMILAQVFEGNMIVGWVPEKQARKIQAAMPDGSVPEGTICTEAEALKRYRKG